MPYHAYLSHQLGVGPVGGQVEPHHHGLPAGVAAPVPSHLPVPPQAVHHVALKGPPTAERRPQVSYWSWYLYIHCKQIIILETCHGGGGGGMMGWQIE